MTNVPRRITVLAERAPSGVWVLEVPDVGAVSQVRDLQDAAEEMRASVAYLLGVSEAEVQIEVRPI